MMRAGFLIDGLPGQALTQSWVACPSFFDWADLLCSPHLIVDRINL
jgi:hypothetical protein